MVVCFGCLIGRVTDWTTVINPVIWPVPPTQCSMPARFCFPTSSLFSCSYWFWSLNHKVDQREFSSRCLRWSVAASSSSVEISWSGSQLVFMCGVWVNIYLLTAWTKPPGETRSARRRCPHTWAHKHESVIACDCGRWWARLFSPQSSLALKDYFTETWGL